MDEQKQEDQLEPIYNSFVKIQDVALKTFRERWSIETGDERGLGRSVLAARQDDDDDFFRDVSFSAILTYFSIQNSFPMS